MELRDEIVESQKVRADLFKWKIILVATLGSLALGIESGRSSGDPATAVAAPASHQYLLCLIPLVCLYVDILCSHLNLRILVIGRYLQYVAAVSESATPAVAYEQFVEGARNLTASMVRRGRAQRRARRAANPGRSFNVFSFEDLAQHFSSSVLSLFVIAWGGAVSSNWVPGESVGTYYGLFFVAAGAAGFALSALAYWRYWRRLDALRGLVETLTTNPAPQGAAH